MYVDICMYFVSIYFFFLGIVKELNIFRFNIFMYCLKVFDIFLNVFCFLIFIFDLDVFINLKSLNSLNIVFLN